MLCFLPKRFATLFVVALILFFAVFALAIWTNKRTKFSTRYGDLEINLETSAEYDRSDPALKLDSQQILKSPDQDSDQ